MSKKDEYTIIRQKSNSQLLFWVFFCIIGFVAIYFPFFGSNLRYQTGNMFSTIFNTIGNICIKIGMMMIGWGILTVFCTKSTKGVALVLIGFCVLTFGYYIVTPVATISPDGTSSKGYH